MILSYKILFSTKLSVYTIVLSAIGALQNNNLYLNQIIGRLEPVFLPINLINFTISKDYALKIPKMGCLKNFIFYC